MLVSLVLIFSLLSLSGLNSEASELPVLTKEKKEQYYQEYLKIVDELSEDNPDYLELHITPMEEIKDEDWIEPELLKEKIIPFINGDKGVVESPFISIEVNAPTKYKEPLNGNPLSTLVINATILISYDSKIGNPIIKDIYNVNSYTMTGLSYWSQAGYRRTDINYNLLITGNLFTNDITIPDAINVSYSFNDKGFIQ